MTFHPGRARKAEKNAHSSDPSIDRQYWAYVAADQLTDALDEIERMRGEMASANVELLAAGELVTQLKRVREAEIDQAGAAERMYLGGVRAKDARIQELEAQLALTTSALENATRKPDVIDAAGTGNLDFSDTNIVDDLIKNGNGLRARVQKAELRIQELEDALAEYQRLGKTVSEAVVPCLTAHGNCDQCRPKAKAACDAIETIRKGKIGSGDHIGEPNKLIGLNADHPYPAEAPRSWQITDERIRAIQWAEEMAGDCKAGDVLRAMLEAGQ